MKMKILIGIGLLCSIFCFEFAAAQQPLKGKFVMEPRSEYDKKHSRYLILKEDFRFAYSETGFYEYNGDWRYTEDGNIVITFDPPQGLDAITSPSPRAYVRDTIKIVNDNTLLIERVSIYEKIEREFFRVPEE